MCFPPKKGSSMALLSIWGIELFERHPQIIPRGLRVEYQRAGRILDYFFVLVSHFEGKASEIRTVATPSPWNLDAQKLFGCLPIQLLKSNTFSCELLLVGQFLQTECPIPLFRGCCPKFANIYKYLWAHKHSYK